MTTDGLHESDENVNIGNDKENKDVEAEEAIQENENDNDIHEDDAENTVEDVNIENAEKVPDIHVQRENFVVENNDEETRPVSQQVTAIPDVIPVHCIATIENCPDATLNEDYSESIRRFLGSEQHLSQNIVSAELSYVSSRSFRNNIYTHTVSVVMYVKTARLWENPANYIRKHLGLSNYWTRSNGTIVRLSRIHQK